MEALVSGFFALLCAATTGFVAYMTHKEDRKRAEAEARAAKDRAEEKAEAERRAKERREESLMIMAMIDANSELTDCLTNITLSGDSSICSAAEAKQKLADRRREYKEFLERIRVEALH